MTDAHVDGAVIEAGDSTFRELVLEASGPVLVDFSAAWCAPCRLVEPLVAELAVTYRGKVRVVRVDTDAHPATAAAYGVTSIPTLFVFSSGEVVRTAIGARPKPELVALVEDVLAAR
ncbi:MAG TPA: thioredoxin [Cellulomonadaceae bacterium]|nr:thioredoxin [Cellulomonadaceae bacterium]